jgi:hypothetical protein
VKLIGKFALIDVGILKVVHKLDRSVLRNIFQTGNEFVRDLLVSESASLNDDPNYDVWHTALGHPLKANVNQKLYKDEYLILAY